MADANPTISIMTLNVNGLNNLIKGRDCQIGLNKRRSDYMMIQETHLDSNTQRRLKVKG